MGRHEAARGVRRALRHRHPRLLRRPHDVIAPPGGRNGTRHLRTWVVLAGGAEHQMDLIRAEAARRSVTIHIIIDIIHVLEYVRGAAWSLHEAGAAGVAGSRRNGTAVCVRYLENKRELLRYDQALQAGWPIATGVIEGACRHLIADRLSVGGARWGLDGAEAVLTLRAVISNGDFHEYWRFHLDCEHRRLYPGIKQGQYTLSS